MVGNTQLIDNSKSFSSDPHLCANKNSPGFGTIPGKQTKRRERERETGDFLGGERAQFVVVVVLVVVVVVVIVVAYCKPL